MTGERRRSVTPSFARGLLLTALELERVVLFGIDVHA